MQPSAVVSLTHSNVFRHKLKPLKHKCEQNNFFPKYKQKVQIKSEVCICICKQTAAFYRLPCYRVIYSHIYLFNMSDTCKTCHD